MNNNNSKIKEVLSPELRHTIVLEDYNRVLANYDKIYDRVGMAFAFCGILLPILIQNVDSRIILDFRRSFQHMSRLELTTNILSFSSILMCYVALFRLFALLKK